MSKMKNVCRYGFLSLLLLGAGSWTAYCFITIAKLKKLIGSVDYINLATSNTEDAAKVLDRLIQFRQMRTWWLIICGIIILAMVALAVCQKLAKRPKKEKAKKEKVKKPKAPKAPKPVPPVTPAPMPVAPASVPVEQPPVAPVPAPVAPAPAPVEQPPVAPAPAPVEQTPVAPVDELEMPTPTTGAWQAPGMLESDTPQSQPVFCAQCGKRFESRPTFCNNCGYKF